MDQTDEQLDEQLERTFVSVSFAANRFIVDHMRRSSKELNIDLESLVILGALAHSNISASMLPGSHYSSDNMEIKLNPIRTSDISLICNTPKETTRRKLGKLKKMGFITRNDKGLWQINREGIKDETRTHTKEIIKRLLKTAKTIETMLNNS